MKQTLKTGFAALALLLVMSCKKESSTFQSSAIDKNILTAEETIDANAAAKIASVTIGSQVWMKKNLDVTNYRNGDPIPEVKDRTKWASLTTGAWCWFKNDSANGSVYGRLYNWYAIKDPRGLAPAGWHVASDDEWTTLTTFLGGEAVAGGKMKSTGTVEAGTGLWLAPNTDATNSSGFKALPGGYRNDDGSFYGVEVYGGWWTDTKRGPRGSWHRDLFYDFGYIYRYSHFWKNGYAIRCVRD
jgi:uncharacterized protein (TIGR02145 family)